MIRHGLGGAYISSSEVYAVPSHTFQHSLLSSLPIFRILPAIHTILQLVPSPFISASRSHPSFLFFSVLCNYFESISGHLYACLLYRLQMIRYKCFLGTTFFAHIVCVTR